MLRPDFEKWNQTEEEILRLSTEAKHPRIRERCLALYMIGTQQTNATQWSQEIGRQDATVQGWIHRYNESGMAGIRYEHTGGPTPLLPWTLRRRSSKR